MENATLPKIELGCGMSPTPGYIHHDRVKHSDFVDIAFDIAAYPRLGIDTLPPFIAVLNPMDTQRNAAIYDRGVFSEILALDVFEHVDVRIELWLNWCWNHLIPGGLLDIRLPAWNHELSYRDPTHLKVFHPETFYYWDPSHALHRDFGSIYFAEAAKWWSVESVVVENNDLRYRLIKLLDRPVEEPT